MKSVVVTGTTRGVGRAITKVLLEDGYHVIATDVSMSQLKEMKKELTGELAIPGGRIDLVEFDLRHVDRIGFLVDAIRKCLDGSCPLWGYVNNAAMYFPSSNESSRLTEIALDDIWEVVTVNMISAFLVSREMFRILREGKEGGSIVLISSAAGHKGSVLNPVYGMTKANLAKSIAHEGGHENIRANAISPGILETQMGLDIYASQERLDERIGKNLIPRACTPDEVAHLAKYLLSDYAGHMTGANLDLSGGSLIK
jgi:NAD(P)-dependent dehydrogenase (short-subunit alcohol dehydrogenase family)